MPPNILRCFVRNVTLRRPSRAQPSAIEFLRIADHFQAGFLIRRASESERVNRYEVVWTSISFREIVIGDKGGNCPTSEEVPWGWIVVESGICDLLLLYFVKVCRRRDNLNR